MYISYSAVIDYRNEFIFVNCKQIDQREGRANGKYSNGVCVTKNCYEVFLRDDKYFRNVNEEQFRSLYAVHKKGSDTKLEDYIQEKKINKLF